MIQRRTLVTAAAGAPLLFAAPAFAQFADRTIKFTNGARASFAATSLSGESWREELTFYGTKGTMRLGRADGLSYQLKGGDRIFPRAATAPDVRPIDDFVEVIHGRRPEPQAPSVCGLRVAQVTEAAYRSATSGRPEPVG